ncbi:MAG: aldehyde ferredoxin oxidoreductase family protein [Candidatus Lokiarchaeota archaeon]|nr:aldehyde ferredoxin oxidoreductase family protein [Candidatus Lokiarchaeota archaeon]
MTNGYFGKILWIDLSKGDFKEESLPDQYYRLYLGGYGLATKLIYENMPAKTDPLSPESIFGFFPGLLTGTAAPLTGRFMVAGKSPLTGTWGDSNCGGYFGPEVKKCGYDAILVKGKSDTPKYVAIIEGEKQFLDASDLWGLDAVETEDKLKEKHGNVQIASIGQAGEKLSLISGIVNDKARIAGRSGFGAIMGSKNLKAIVLKGNVKIPIVDNKTLLELTRTYNEGINATKGGMVTIFRTFGTTAGNVFSATSGDTPIKNWGGTSKDDFPLERLNKISGPEINKYKQKSYGCFSCPVQCGAIMKVPEADIEETHRPEYETCASLGHMILNDDLTSIFILNDLCNRAGIDTISVGGTIAFAIECYENGLLTKEDTDGLELTWGNSSAVIELLKKMIQREGFGDILADGSKVASERLGKGKEYAIHSLGQELGMHSPKFYKSMGATYAFDPTPGRHTTATLDMLAGGSMFRDFNLPKNIKSPGDERSEAEMKIAGFWQTICSLGLCEFATFFQQYPLAGLIKALTGWEMSMDEFLEIGLRIQTLRQAFTIREGVDIIKNKLPDRTYDSDYLADYKDYCRKMGWDPENAYPLEETLKALNLEFVIKDLY